MVDPRVPLEKGLVLSDNPDVSQRGEEVLPGRYPVGTTIELMDLGTDINRTIQSG